MPMPKEDENILENFRPHKAEKFRLKKQKNKKNLKDLVNKSFNLRNYIKVSLINYIPQNRLFINKS